MDLLQSVLNGLQNESGEADLVLLNPALDKNLQNTLQKIAGEQQLNGPHIWLTSSGSSAGSQREIKLIALAKKAMLSSAAAINEHLEAQKSDRWLNVLPSFHVGGLGIFYRAFLSGSEAINLYQPTYKWNAEQFYQNLQREKITLTSLVPTQVFDLVAGNYLAPPALRAVVVGGAALTPSLYLQARQLGWPLLPSFGMTEVCSQIATASLDSLAPSRKQFVLDNDLQGLGQLPNQSSYPLPKLQILKHVELQQDENNFLQIKSASLMSCYVQLRGDSFAVNSFTEGAWYKTQDRVKIEGRIIECLGRGDEVVKILGENVNLAFLRQKLEEFLIQYRFDNNWVLITKEDVRKGAQLILVLEQQSYSANSLITTILAEFNRQVLPFERITQIKYIKKIPKSALGKVLYGALIEIL